MAISYEEKQKEIWTTNKIIEEFHYDFISAKGQDGLRKYEQQAKFLLYRIPVWGRPGTRNKQSPTFTINLKDICEEVKKQLNSVSTSEVRSIVKEAVSIIFENLGAKEREHFNKNVRSLLRVKFV